MDGALKFQLRVPRSTLAHLTYNLKLLANVTLHILILNYT